MRILRNIAAAILACEAVGITIVFPWILHHLGDRFQVNRLELGLSFLVASSFLGIAAWQVYREHPRTIAWTSSLLSVLFFRGVLRIPVSIPLIYLLVRAGESEWRKRRKPPQAANPPSLPEETAQATAGSAPLSTPHAETTPQPASAPADGTSGILETIIGFVAVFSHRAILRSLPAWLLPAVPADAYEWHWISFLLGITLTTFFHELGHAVAGNLVGFQMARFFVYPFEYARSSKHRYFRLNFKSPASGLYVGFPKSVENLQSRHIFMTAFGPIGGIVFSLLCWCTLMLADGRITGPWFGALHTAMSFGLVTNVLNLLPFKSNGLRLDGRVLWDAWFDRPASADTVAMLGCSSSLRSNLRPRDWPAAWVAYLRRHRSDAFALALFSNSAEDRLTTSPTDPEARKDLALASEGFSQLTEKLKEHPEARTAFEFHRSWLRCRYFGENVSVDFAKAQAHRETEPYEILRLQAALAAFDGDSDSAVELIGQAETSLASNLKNGIDAADLDALRAFREELLIDHPACLPDWTEHGNSGGEASWDRDYCDARSPAERAEGIA